MGSIINEEREAKYTRLYLMIIERYKDYIEQRESLSVAELPTLVTPTNELVLKKVEEIKSSFSSYSYDSNFYEASIKAFNFVKSSIESVVLPVQFWLTPEEILSFGMGDEVDKSILLCSMLIALGNHSAKVLMYTRDNERKTLVYHELKGKIYLLDNADGIREFNDKDEMLRSLGIKDNTTAYEFNNRTYRDIS